MPSVQSPILITARRKPVETVVATASLRRKPGTCAHPEVLITDDGNGMKSVKCCSCLLDWRSVKVVSL